MDEDQRSRLQLFLTIMDTIHDYGDINRADVHNNSLKSRVLQTLNRVFNEAILKEQEYLGMQHPTAKSIKKLYDDIYLSYEGFKIPNSFHQRVVDITMTILQRFCKIDIKETSHKNNLEMYKFMQSICQKFFIKYILDKNKADNNLFCIDPNIVKANIQYKVNVKNENAFKTILVGKHTEYDSQWNNQSGSELLNAQTRNISSYFSSAGGLNFPCVLHKDTFNYELRKDSSELLFFDKLGVKKFGNEYQIYHSINNEDSIIEIGKFPPKSSTGLPLFLQAFSVVDSKNYEAIEKLEIETLKTIAKVFKISCNKFNVALPRNTQLSPEYFTYALYDLKRAMDYLQVKACAIANEKKAYDNTKLVWVSSDRFGILYALLNEVPCILTTDIQKQTVYSTKNLLKEPTKGGMPVKVQSRKHIDYNSKEYLEKELIDLYEENDKILFDDILTHEDTLFQKFLHQYKRVSQAPHMSFIWYIIYKTVYGFLENGRS
jgi:hypothetical protein